MGRWHHSPATPFPLFPRVSPFPTAFTNQVTPLLLGYLRVFLRVFGTDWITTDLKRDLDSATQTLTTAIQEHIVKAHFGRRVTGGQC